MKRSTERILTTHTGSLPRPADLTILQAAIGTDEYYRAAVDTNQRLTDSIALRLNAMVHRNVRQVTGAGRPIRGSLTQLGAGLADDQWTLSLMQDRLGSWSLDSQPECAGDLFWLTVQ